MCVFVCVCVCIQQHAVEEMVAAVLHTLTLVYESDKRLEEIAAQG